MEKRMQLNIIRLFWMDNGENPWISMKHGDTCEYNIVMLQPTLIGISLENNGISSTKNSW
jgi:hypothetical protein